MSALSADIATKPHRRIPSAEERGDVQVSERRLLAAEWLKLRSLRSTWYSLLATLVTTVGFGLIACATASRTDPHDHDINPFSRSLVGSEFGLLAIGVLGVLVITNEYSTGMIRSSMMAAPKRLPVLWAKIGVYAQLALAAAIPMVLAAFFIGQAILSSKHMSISLSHPGVTRALIGTILYMGLAGLFALGIGAIARNTAAGITIFAGIMFILSHLVELLPSSVSNAVNPYLPDQAGSAVTNLTRQAHTLAPWTGLALFAGYTVLALAIAAYLLKRRDV